MNVSLDASTPASKVLANGQTGVDFATIDLSAVGGNAIIQSLSIVSDSSNATSGLADIFIYDGSKSIGFAPGLGSLASAQGGDAEISLSSPITLMSGQSVALTLEADLTAQATGSSFDLGIGGGGGNFATMTPNHSVYGNSMTVSQ